jgi:transglutaminase-like putative cysteine protease
MAVPLRGRIPNPRECKKLKVRLNGYVLDPDGLESHRQFVAERFNDAVVIKLTAQQKPADIAGFRAQMPPELHQFLTPSAAVQSDSQEIIKQAEAIVEGSLDCFEAAKSINEWVYRNVIKKPTVSLPSALDVLQRREGDCNEHTYLFVALARAVGLPARINVGIVFAEIDGQPGAFYYHAWPAVFVGQWVEMDPTFGTPLVDATYIRLISGEIIDQMKLLGILGRISVDVME